MTGFSQSSTAAISRWLPCLSVRAIDPGPGVGAATPSRPDGAERSAPEQKCLPSAANTTTRTSPSSLARSRRSIISSRCAGVSAFAAAGRFSVIRATPSVHE